jgi:hypothetical protein
MGSLMQLMMKQGNLIDARAFALLQNRVTELENLIKTLQSEQRPKLGRPAKVNDEPRQTQVDSPSRD